MTRFARAEGSKASNKRILQEPTAWQDLKKPVVSKSHEATPEPPAEPQNAEKSLGWTKFPKKKSIKEGKVKKKTSSDAKSLEKKFKQLMQDIGTTLDKEESSVVEKKPKRRKKNALPKESCSGISTAVDVDGSNPEGSKESLVVEKKSKRKKKNALPKECSSGISTEVDVDGSNPEGSKKAKKRARNDAEPSSKVALTEDFIKKINKKQMKKLRQAEKRKQFKDVPKIAEQYPTQKQKQKPKLKSDDFKRRKAPLDCTVTIGNKKLEIQSFDGFPIKKEDASRLIQLKKDLISKGVPKSEVRATVKLERRKAEKALTRERRKVCFKCRKEGHLLSECPELFTEAVPESGTGICYKCGSTEHTHFQCRVVKTPDFKFASCFICNEQGHISRQCPDNARGLYPKGGACRICGDVTHLKRDCPKFQDEQEGSKITLETIDDQNIESLKNEEVINKKPVIRNKVVKF